MSNGNTEFIKEIITTFLETIPKSIAEIRQLTATKTWDSLARATHKIRPSLTMMGLPVAKELSIEIEANASSKKDRKLIPGQVKEFCGMLESAWQDLSQIKI